MASPSTGISACLIVKNEERTLGGCLRSLRTFVDEVVVVDTGSTDTTIALARDLGAKVHQTRWTNDFSAARNLSLEHATQPFILVIDADERLLAQSAPRLRSFCAAASAPGTCVVRNVLASTSSAASGDSAYSSLRVFPNTPEYRYHGRVHEQVLRAGAAPIATPTGVELIHLGYESTLASGKDRVARNLELLELELRDRPGDPYVLYQIGRTCVVGGDHQRAVQSLLASFATLKGVAQPPLYLSAVLLQLTFAWLGLRQLRPTLDVLSLATDLYPDFTDLYFAYGTALLELAEPTPARLHDIRQAFEYCLQLGEPDPTRYESVAGVGSYRALHNLATFHEVTGNTTAARDHYRRAADFGFEPARARLRALAA